MPHTDHMDRALALAALGAGHVSPNPMVGAVLVGPDGEVWGEGYHRAWGGPHAEVEAVRDAERRGNGGRLREATMVVTLEPCSHHGKTPPCADLIIERGIPRVVMATPDPFPAVAGRGLARLRAAGLEVTVGVREREARRLNEAFLTHVAMGRPLVTLKLALTLDGRVATRTGSSRWITGAEARARVHALRAQADAVLVGAGTALADDPALTVRDVPEGAAVRPPLRVVLDRTGGLPPTLRLFTDSDAAQTVAVVGEGVRPAYAVGLEGGGGHVWTVREQSGHLDLGAVLDRLGAKREGGRPVQSVLVEAGPGLATALLQQDLVDRLLAFVAPRLVGGDGRPAVGALGVAEMADARGFVEGGWETLGADALFSGYLRSVDPPAAPDAPARG